MKPMQPTTPWNPESVVVVKNICEYCNNTVVKYVAYCNVGDLYALRFLVEIKISSHCKIMNHNLIKLWLIYFITNISDTSGFYTIMLVNFIWWKLPNTSKKHQFIVQHIKPYKSPPNTKYYRTPELKQIFVTVCRHLYPSSAFNALKWQPATLDLRQ